MPDGQVLEFSGLTKRFRSIAAVSDFTARVEPGLVTGFLGPNGAGKTTTLRALLGLIRADAGTALIGGVAYAKLKQPLQTVGAVLEASSFHPGRSGANHLKVYAQAAGLPLSRIDETLGTVGLADAAGRKVGGYSLGMRQRLGLAYALLGDPGVLVLDEPANGLDPEGIKWLRGLLRQLAREGRTVLVSSHLLAEVQQTVDALLIISRGRLVFQGSLEELTDPSEYATVTDAPDRAALAAALRGADVPFEVLRSGLTVRGADPSSVGAVAASAGIALSLLQRRGPALEEVFLELVNGERVHESASGRVRPPMAELAAGPSAESSAPRGGAGFAVAGTGVVDIVETGADSGAGVDVEAEAPVEVDTSVEADAVVDVEADAVAADGVTDAAEDAVEEADADEADAEYTEGEGDRPWESAVKTEADIEADRFFAAFDSEESSDQEEPPAAESDAAAEAESEVESDSAAEPEPEAASDSEAEPETAAESESASDSQVEVESEFEPAPDPEPDVAIGDDPTPETSEFGSLADLYPEWAQSDDTADADPSDDHEGGEQR